MLIRSVYAIKVLETNRKQLRTTVLCTLQIQFAFSPADAHTCRRSYCFAKMPKTKTKRTGSNARNKTSMNLLLIQALLATHGCCPQLLAISGDMLWSCRNSCVEQLYQQKSHVKSCCVEYIPGQNSSTKLCLIKRLATIHAIERAVLPSDTQSVSEDAQGCQHRGRRPSGFKGLWWAQEVAVCRLLQQVGGGPQGPGLLCGSQAEVGRLQAPLQGHGEYQGKTQYSMARI